MASIRQRGRKYYAEVRRRGIYRTGTFRTKTQAKQWASEIEDAIDDSRAFDVTTLHDALRRYEQEVSSKKPGGRWEIVRLQRFARELPDTPIDRVTAADIADWRDTRLRTVATSSVRREMVLLSSVFSIARREWGLIERNPMADVRKPADRPAREQLISDDQAQALMTAAGYVRGQRCYTTRQLTAAALDLALETAMRQGEIINIRGNHVDLDQRVVTLPKTKNGTVRQVPLSSSAVEILESLDQERPFPVTSGSMSATFRKITASAGLAGEFTFHDSRATAITRLAKRLDIHDLARMTGHRDLRMLMRYYRAPASAIARQLD